MGIYGTSVKPLGLLLGYRGRFGLPWNLVCFTGFHRLSRPFHGTVVKDGWFHKRSLKNDCHGAAMGLSWRCHGTVVDLLMGMKLNCYGAGMERATNVPWCPTMVSNHGVQPRGSIRFPDIHQGPMKRIHVCDTSFDETPRSAMGTLDNEVGSLMTVPWHSHGGPTTVLWQLYGSPMPAPCNTPASLKTVPSCRSTMAVPCPVSTMWRSQRTAGGIIEANDLTHRATVVATPSTNLQEIHFMGIRLLATADLPALNVKQNMHGRIRSLALTCDQQPYLPQ